AARAECLKSVFVMPIAPIGDAGNGSTKWSRRPAVVPPPPPSRSESLRLAVLAVNRMCNSWLNVTLCSLRRTGIHATRLPDFPTTGARGLAAIDAPGDP
ncbi:hypothetical protein DBT42_08965, partial [Aerococcus urinae]